MRLIYADKINYHERTECMGHGDFETVRTVTDKEIAEIPTVDAAPVRHGRWLFVTKGQMTSAWCCSECGRTVVITCDEEFRQRKLEKEYPFCHCGAKMDLEV